MFCSKIGMKDKKFENSLILFFKFVLSFTIDNELSAIRQRQGIDAAKTKGVRFGRPINPLHADFADLLKQLSDKQISHDTMFKMCNMSKPHFTAGGLNGA
jgi:DNA invertase Pin-like site-specific DNA recombinase